MANFSVDDYLPRLYCTFGPLGHGPPNNWKNFTRARPRIDHVANFACAILANRGKLARAHTWLLTMLRIRTRVIWANLRMRDYWPCREFACAGFEQTRIHDLAMLLNSHARLWLLTRVYANKAIDQVANSHVRDLRQIAHVRLLTMTRIRTRVFWANSCVRDFWQCLEFACIWLEQTRACTYATWPCC